MKPPGWKGIAVYKRFAAKIGVNYVWGVANYTLGVVCGSFTAGLVAGIIHH
jgi:hypothetical protein